MAREAVKGKAIFEKVSEMQKAEPGMSQQAAFAKLAESGEFGTRPGTIAANYYRMARQSGMTRGSKKRRSNGQPRQQRARQNGQQQMSMPELERLVAEVNDAIGRLAAYAEGEAARVKRMRELIGQS